MLRTDYLDFYNGANFTLIPVKQRSKIPEISGWQERRQQHFDPAEFSKNSNVGVVLGDASGGLVDIDLDCREALILAPLFLPATGFKFGRKSKPNSHWFYRCALSGKTVRLTRSDGMSIVECRANGGQTVVPPSVHASGERIEFSEQGLAVAADFDDLVLRCKLLAIAIEIAPYWSAGTRHDLSLAVAGALLRAGVTIHDVSQVIKGICRLRKDDEEQDRLRAIDSTAARILRSEPATGWPTLSEFIGSRLCEHINRWFGAKGAEQPSIDELLFTRDSLNDAGNAERTKRLFGNDLIYVTQLRRFFCWDGIRWVEDIDNLRTRKLCLDSVDQLLSQFRSGLIHTFNNEKVLNFLRRSRDHARLNAQFDLLKSLLACNASTLDASDFVVGCRNGVIDLGTGQHSSPDRSAKITKLLNAEYDPSATCPMFERLVSDMLGDDQDKVEFVQRLAGYWLTGSTKYHVFPILVGDAACGKTTFVNAIKDVLGDYGTDMMPDTLFETSASAIAQYDLATLRGRRFVVAQEAESEKRLRAGVVKAITGGDTLKVRLPYQEPWGMPPSAKFLMVANRRPNLDALDPGLRRRIVIIECGDAIPEQRQDSELAEKLRSEKPGILNWLLSGGLRLRQSGLTMPDVLRQSIDQFFNDKNELSSFWSECIEKLPGAKISVSELYDAYRTYCAQEAVEPRGQREFGRLLRTIFNVEQSRTGSIRFWKGIQLRCELSQNDMDLRTWREMLA